jgi:hypothetical protein
MTERFDPILGATDSQLEGLSESEASEVFAMGEAMGAGDFELSDISREGVNDPFVTGLDPGTMPTWTPDFLAKVREALKLPQNTSVEVLSQGLVGTREEREQAQADMNARLDALLGPIEPDKL